MGPCYAPLIVESVRPTTRAHPQTQVTWITSAIASPEKDFVLFACPRMATASFTACDIPSIGPITALLNETYCGTCRLSFMTSTPLTICEVPTLTIYVTLYARTENGATNSTPTCSHAATITPSLSTDLTTTRLKWETGPPAPTSTGATIATTTSSYRFPSGPTTSPRRLRPPNDHAPIDLDKLSPGNEAPTSRALFQTINIARSRA